MPLYFGWGCRTFQTASHVHAIYIWGVWTSSWVVDGHMVPHLHSYHHRHFLSFVRVGWNPTWCKCKPCHYALVEAIEPFKLHPILCHTYMRGLSAFSGCGWAYGFTFTSLPPQTLLQICESWLKSYLMQVCKPCHYALADAIEPFKLHSMSILHIYEVFERLLRMWMGIWLHTHTVTITDASPDLWEFAEILPDASVQTMPLRFGWGCRTFETASHVFGISIWGIWASSQDVDGHMASHSHCYHHSCFSRFGKLGWNPTWCKCANHATMLWLRL